MVNRINLQAIKPLLSRKCQSRLIFDGQGAICVTLRQPPANENKQQRRQQAKHAASAPAPSVNERAPVRMRQNGANNTLPSVLNTADDEARLETESFAGVSSPTYIGEKTAGANRGQRPTTPPKIEYVGQAQFFSAVFGRAVQLQNFF